MRKLIIFALLTATVVGGGCQNSQLQQQGETIERNAVPQIIPPQAEPQINGPRGKLPPKGY